MRTRAILSGLLLLGATCGVREARATLLDAGTQEVRIGGMIDFETPDGSLLQFDAGYGLFLLRNVGLLGALHLRHSQRYSMWAVRLLAEYHWDFGTFWIPYTGAGVGLGTARITRETFTWDAQNAILFSAQAWIKYHLADHAALGGGLVFEYATEPFYPTRRAPSAFDLRIELSMRFYF